MKADGRALDQADVFRSLPDRGFEAGEAGRRPDPDPRAGDSPPPFGGFGEVASGMILGSPSPARAQFALEGLRLNRQNRQKPRLSTGIILGKKSKSC